MKGGNDLLYEEIVAYCNGNLKLVKTTLDYMNKKLELDFKKKEDIVLDEKYPKCESTKKKEDVVLDEKCPKCGSTIVLRNGKFGEFKACSNFPKCKYIA